MPEHADATVVDRLQAGPTASVVASLALLAPHLSQPERAALAADAVLAWQTATDRATARRDVARVLWDTGARAGRLAGRHQVGEQVITAVLARAEPARVEMSDKHLARANWLQSARVTPQALTDYLTGHGWRPAGTGYGAALFEHPATRANVLVAEPDKHDYTARMWEAATNIALVEDRSTAAVLADLAPTAPRGRLSHDALHFLEQAHDHARDLYRRGTGAPAPTPAEPLAGTPAHAARHGYLTGYRRGLAEGRDSAAAWLLRELDALPAQVRTASIDNRPAHGWLREVLAAQPTSAAAATGHRDAAAAQAGVVTAAAPGAAHRDPRRTAPGATPPGHTR
jgi:hypothetical protein